MQLVSIIVPSRGRPVGLLRFIASALMTTRNHNVEIIPVLDAPDTESQALLKPLHWLRTIVMPDDYVDGHPQQKFQAGFLAAKGKWVVTGTDDITYHEGWLDCMLVHPNKGFVGFYDSHHKMNLATLYMVSKDYVNTVMNGWLGLPWYRIIKSDREYMERAKRAGAWTICRLAGFDHHHHAFGKVPMDDRAKFAKQWLAQDRKTFRQRKAAGFPNEWPHA